MPTIKELEDQLAAAKAAEAAEYTVKAKIAANAWNAMSRNPDSWEYQAKPDKYTIWGWSMSERQVVEGLYITRRLTEAALDAYRADHGNVTDRDATVWKGMFYYRTDEGILHQDGGGTCILKTPKLCNDQEWAELTAARIPAKFRR